MSHETVTFENAECWKSERMYDRESAKEDRGPETVRQGAGRNAFDCHERNY